MGPLPSPTPAQIDPDELSLLFKSQQQILKHFFNNLDLAQSLLFASPSAVFFIGVGKFCFIAHKLSQTLASLGLSRSSFLPPVDALDGDIGSLFAGELLILISKFGSSDELLTLVPCSSAKGATPISVTSVAGNSPKITSFLLFVSSCLGGTPYSVWMRWSLTKAKPQSIGGHNTSFAQGPTTLHLLSYLQVLLPPSTIKMKLLFCPLG